jgi:hypothetical protein
LYTDPLFDEGFRHTAIHFPALYNPVNQPVKNQIDEGIAGHRQKNPGK